MLDWENGYATVFDWPSGELRWQDRANDSWGVFGYNLRYIKVRHRMPVAKAPWMSGPVGAPRFSLIAGDSGGYCAVNRA